MTEATGFAANPIPAQPSAESIRQLAKAARMRRGLQRSQPHGWDLRISRAIFASVAATVRAPKGGSVRRVRGVRGVTGPGADPANGILLWIHGGSFVTGGPRLEQLLAAGYANTARIPACLPRYRRPPEHPFPAASDDVLAAYRDLLDQGYSADTIRIGGLSAGGALTVGLLTDLRHTGLPLPAAVLLGSPVLQLSTELAHARDARHPDPFCAPDYIERTNRVFAGATPLSDPRLDHLNADTTGWPPVLIQVGGTECLLDEAQALGARIRAQGGRCEVQVWPGQVHAFTIIGGRTPLPEAVAAIDYGATFLAG
ncbi:MAG TPA: alpha/beta hydrolase fold domain-containing protein [Pseudonocardiaceae bacterium]|jgi:acetyl esterase/lipase